ncbi:MAG: glycoside hydrolase family 9 protein [Propionibacteriaceae bacterium]|jgi:hypothetical protein|nr:glycoside hydrolase family 9 protein [Propionibacteriaceae bacterium]
MRLTTNHLGYLPQSSVRLLLRGDDHPDATATCVRTDTGQPLPTSISAPVKVVGWTPGVWRVITIDTADLNDSACPIAVTVTDGSMVVAEATCEVGPDVIANKTISDVLYYFKSVRSSGQIDRKDRHALFFGDSPTRDSGRSGTVHEVDAHGGWLDASGDHSKFLSHLTYTTMMSPQQIPLVAWAMMAGDEALRENHPDLWPYLHDRLRDEGLHGADFLIRFQHPSGYFYTAIFDALTKRLDERVVTAPLQDCVRTDRYQAAFRHGGGMAIAALARAVRLDDHGDNEPDAYWRAAVTGLAHLDQHNTEYFFNGTESIIDDYCALMAACELEATWAAVGRPATGSAITHTMADPTVQTRETLGDATTSSPGTSAIRHAESYDPQAWRETAQRRAACLMARYQPGGTPSQAGHLIGDAAGRPYFHAVESGLPIIALVRYHQVFDRLDPAGAKAAGELAIQLCRDWLTRTYAVANPFGYPRALTQPLGGEPRESFFFPHANETGYWWQGENANICSLSAAATMVSRLEDCPEQLADELRGFAHDQLSWVLGRNPFDVCMLQGRGSGNREYSTHYPNVPGGILNGITAGFEDESDIDFLPDAPQYANDSWRWAEQWIPHAGWFVLATALAK